MRCLLHVTAVYCFKTIIFPGNIYLFKLNKIETIEKGVKYVEN